jgi:hypothetical protein
MLSKLTFWAHAQNNGLAKKPSTFRASYSSSAIFVLIESQAGLIYASFITQGSVLGDEFQSQLEHSVMKLRSLKRMERSFRRGNGEGSKGPDIEEKWMMRKT